MKKVLLLGCLIAAFSCTNKNQKLILADSNGSVNNILLVIDNDVWKGQVGENLRDVISEPVVGLPQPENQFGITRVTTDGFKGMLKSSRNILYIEENTSASGFKIATNLYAEPQKIISIIEKDKASLVKLIKENAKSIIRTFKDNDLKVVQKRQKKEERKADTIKVFENLGIYMTIPHYFYKAKTEKESSDFIWLSYDVNSRKGHSLNLLAYQIPISSQDDVLGNTIVKNRDSLGQLFIHGEKEEMYMITEKAYSPYRYDAIVDGKKAFETRGKWDMKNDYMAGPFLNYTVLDKAKNRLVVVEGFVYAPITNKRDYMFELEAILKTLKID